MISTKSFTKRFSKLPNDFPNYQTIFQITKRFSKLPNDFPNYQTIFQITLQKSDLFYVDKSEK
jgi:hypothetical protein